MLATYTCWHCVSYIHLLTLCQLHTLIDIVLATYTCCCHPIASGAFPPPSTKLQVCSLLSAHCLMAWKRTEICVHGAMIEKLWSPQMSIVTATCNPEITLLVKSVSVKFWFEIEFLCQYWNFLCLLVHCTYRMLWNGWIMKPNKFYFLWFYLWFMYVVYVSVFLQTQFDQL